MLYRCLERCFKRLLAGDSAVDGGPVSVRNVVVWLFIVMVAIFLTHPAGAPPVVSGMHDTPAPWPAELGLDDRFGI